MGIEGYLEIYDAELLESYNLIKEFKKCTHGGAYIQNNDFLNKKIIYYYWDTEYKSDEIEEREKFEFAFLVSWEIWT